MSKSETSESSSLDFFVDEEDGFGDDDWDTFELRPESMRSSVVVDSTVVILHDEDDDDMDEPWPLEHKLEQLLMLLLHRCVLLAFVPMIVCLSDDL